MLNVLIAVKIRASSSIPGGRLLDWLWAC